MYNPFKKENLKQATTKGGLVGMFGFLIDGIATGFSGTVIAGLLSSITLILNSENKEDQK